MLCLDGKEQQLPSKTQPQQREQPPLKPGSHWAEKSHQVSVPQSGTARTCPALVPQALTARRSLTLLAFHSGTRVPERGEAGVSRGQQP